MQTLCMFHPQAEPLYPPHLPQRLVQTPGGILTEHQVLSIGQGERLFVCALYRCLYRRTQGTLQRVDQLGERQVLQVLSQSYSDLGLAALTMGRSDDALIAAEPFQ